MAPPSKLSIDVQEAICKHIEGGAFRKRAGALEGISERTITEWYSRGSREERGVYFEFFRAVNRAEATFQQNAIAALRAGSATNASLLLKWLGRRFPAEWGRQDNIVEISAVDQANQAEATRALLFQRLAALFPKPEAESSPRQIDEGQVAEFPVALTPNPKGS
jgi:hypothetical protein